MSLNNTPIEQRIFGTISDSLRPSTIQPYNSQNIFIDGVKIIGGPMWAIHPVYSKNVIITNTNIQTQVSNGDGIVIDSSEKVLIDGNALSTDDDAIVIKSGRDVDGWNVNKPSQNIVIKNSTINHAHAGVGFGSEMSGGIKNVFVDNMNITNATRGFRLKTTTGRGGYIKNIIIQNSIINNPIEKGSININKDYGSNTIKPKTKKEPKINNIKFTNIKLVFPQNNMQNDIIIIKGIENNLSHILFSNIETNNKKSKITIKKSNQILFDNVSTTNYYVEDSKDIIIVNDICSNINKKNSTNISNVCK
jgi:polygalacturonase